MKFLVQCFRKCFHLRSSLKFILSPRDIRSERTRDHMSRTPRFRARRLTLAVRRPVLRRSEGASALLTCPSVLIRGLGKRTSLLRSKRPGMNVSYCPAGVFR
jgi:hypothetical protein